MKTGRLVSTSRSFVARGLIAVLLLAAAPRVALAHGRLKSATPGAGAHLGIVPRELRFVFSEVPDLTFSEITLVGPDGRPVTLAPLVYSADSKRTVVAAINESLPSGTYIVRWQLAGDDGHPIRGQYEFVIAPGAMAMGQGGTSPESAGQALEDSGGGSATMHHDPASMPEGNGFGAESPAYAAVRWTQFIALLFLVGTVTFRQFVLALLRRRQDTDAPMLDDAEQGAARLGLVAAWILACTLLLRLFAQSYAMHGSARLWDVSLSMQMIGKTVWGKGWLLQLAAVVAAVVGFRIAGGPAHPRQLNDAPHNRGRLGWRLAALSAVGLALSLALSGHAASAPRLPTLAVVADSLHVLGASSWLGSLAVVLFVGIPAARRLGDARRDHAIAHLVNAFSPVALASAGLAVTTGVFAAWLHVGRIPNLWETNYGLTLLVKLAVLGIVSLTGFYNWRIVKPRLGTDQATRHLLRSARVEVTVAVLVLLVTAILVATPTSMDMQM